MLGVFQSVRGLLKIDNVAIDNSVFRLHYKATVIILVVASLLVTSSQYIGDPIDCMVDGVPQKLMDTYCWIHSTFTLPRTIGKDDVGHPGIGTPDDNEERKYHKYYQWVCFFLFFQAILFFIPRYLWKAWEGGRCKMLVMEMNCPIMEEEVKNKRKKMLIDYFSQNLRNHNMYAIRFFFCEALNFINIIGQIYFTDFFLGYEFTTYGTRVIEYANADQEDRTDPMAMVFPKVTKCTFLNYGPSGTPQHLDGLCVLSLNIIIEKIYICLFFWFISVAVLSGVGMLYRAIVIASPEVRLYLLRARARLALADDVNAICRKCQIGDWFLLYQLGKNIDPFIFREILHEMACRLEGKDIL